MKSDIDIKDDLFKLIKGTELENVITGKLSKKGRPLGSDKEDIIISILENSNGQIQEAFVNVNIYIPDVLNSENGDYEIHDIRCRELCNLSKFLLSSGWNGARVDIRNSKQRVLKVEGKNEHFINNKLLIKIFNE